MPDVKGEKTYELEETDFSNGKATLKLDPDCHTHFIQFPKKDRNGMVYCHITITGSPGTITIDREDQPPPGDSPYGSKR